MQVPPVLLAIICQPSPHPKIVEHEELIAVGMAVQNLMLAARALDIGSYWTSGKKAFHPKMAEFLRLTPPARCLGFLYLGYPAGPWPEGRRGPSADKLSAR
jgi:nitroreductase